MNTNQSKDLDHNRWLDSMSEEITKDRIEIIDIKEKLCGSTPNIKEATDIILSKKQIAWAYNFFPFDLMYAAMKQENDKQLRIYNITNDYKPIKWNENTMTDFLHVDLTNKDTKKFWTKELKKYGQKDPKNPSKSIIFALGLKCNSYSLSVENIVPTIVPQSFPFWVTTFLDGNDAQFRLLFGKIDLINKHIYIERCVGLISLPEISIRGLVYVFGLRLNGELSLKNGFEAQAANEALQGSVALALTVSSEGDDALSYGVILDHWTTHFPQFALFFDACQLLFCNVQIINFKCALSASVTPSIYQTESGKETQKTNEAADEKEKEEKAAEKEKRTGRKAKAKTDDTPKPVTYAIDLSFQPQLNPKGAIGVLLGLIGIKVAEIHEMFPLKLYMKGDNVEGLKLGAKVEKRYDLKTWLFDVEIIYFDSLKWSGGIEYDTEEEEVTLEVAAELYLMLKLDFIPDLGQALMSGFMSGKVNCMDPMGTAEITVGWCIHLGDENGWDPFSLVGLDSGFKLKSIAMGMSITAQAQLCIMAASSFSLTFADEVDDNEIENGKNDVIIAIKVAIDIPKECGYPTAFHLEQKGQIHLRNVLKLLAPLPFKLVADQCPDIWVRNCTFSFGLDKKTEIVYDIGFTADDEDVAAENANDKKAIKMADALNNLDTYHLENKVVTITQGLKMKGEMTICNVIEIKGELILSPSLFKMRVGFHAEKEKMERFKVQIKEKLDSKLRQYEKELFPDSFEREVENIAKQVNKWTLGVVDVITLGNGAKVIEAALSFGFNTAKAITMKCFQLVQSIVNAILKHISIYEFLYHLELSTSALPIFKFKLNMKIGDFVIDIDIDTSRDFSLKAFFQALIDGTKYWLNLLAEAGKKAAQFAGSILKTVGDFVWKCIGGEMIVNFFSQRRKRFEALENIRRAAEEDRIKWEKDMKQKRNKWKQEIEDLQREMRESKDRFIEDEIAYYQERKREKLMVKEDIESKVTNYEKYIERLDEQIAKKNTEIKDKLEPMNREIKLLENKYKEQDDIIREAINKTGQDEKNVAKFLKVLNNGLLFALTQNAQCSDALFTKMGAFDEFLKKECEYKLTVEEWFGVKGLIRFIPILNEMEEDEYETMDDVLDCYQDFYDELKAITTKHEEMDDFTEDEMNVLQTFSDEQNAEDTWRKYENEKQMMIKEKLVKTTPILTAFLKRMMAAMNYVSLLLNISAITDLNKEQKEAIDAKNAAKNKEEWMKIKPKIYYDDDETKEEIYYEDIKDINDIKDKYGAYLHEKQLQDIDDIKNIKKHCDAIEIAARLRLNIVNDLRNEYKEDDDVTDAFAREAMFQLASNIEYCCIEIMAKQAMIRKSVLLARELIEYKSMNLSSEAKPLWNEIDKGIIGIFENAIEISKIFAQYSSFLTKINDGFQQFRSYVELNKNISLAVALEFVSKDVKEFVLFGSEQIKPTVTKLKKSAQCLVDNCVRQSIACGNSGISTAIDAKNEAETEYLEKRRAFNDVKYRFDDVYRELRGKRARLMAQYKSKIYYLEHINDSIPRLAQHIKELQESKREIS